VADTFELLIDQPFIIMIEDVGTGLILFAGIIREP
jgi:serine protease inhibitor